MTEDQFSQLTQLIKTQNEMIARIGFILVRAIWLLVTIMIILILILAWII